MISLQHDGQRLSIYHSSLDIRTDGGNSTGQATSVTFKYTCCIYQQTDRHIHTHRLVPTSSRFPWTWWVGAEKHVWTETHSLLFPLQQTVLQMSSIIPPSSPSHSSTLSHAIMAIAPSGVPFPLMVKFFPMIGEFPITGHKAKNARHVFFPTFFAAWLRSCDEAPPIRSPHLTGHTLGKKPSRNWFFLLCLFRWQWGQRLEYAPSRPLETRQQWSSQGLKVGWWGWGKQWVPGSLEEAEMLSPSGTI